MRDDSTVPGGAERPGESGDGILAAVVFALVSLLLIATLPAGDGTRGDRALEGAGSVAGARP
jgi:hypothetical protein